MVSGKHYNAVTLVVGFARLCSACVRASLFMYRKRCWRSLERFWYSDRVFSTVQMHKSACEKVAQYGIGIGVRRPLLSYFASGFPVSNALHTLSVPRNRDKNLLKNV